MKYEVINWMRCKISFICLKSFLMCLRGTRDDFSFDTYGAGLWIIIILNVPFHWISINDIILMIRCCQSCYILFWGFKNSWTPDYCLEFILLLKLWVGENKWIKGEKLKLVSKIYRGLSAEILLKYTIEDELKYLLRLGSKA